MQLPFMMLSYGDFSITKKLFWYETDETHLLPLFTDSEAAAKFVDGMQKVPMKNNNKLELRVQVCDNIKSAIAIFTTIITILPSLQTIIVNPVLGEESGDIKNIGEVIYSFQTALSSLEVDESDS